MDFELKTDVSISSRSGSLTRSAHEGARRWKELKVIWFGRTVRLKRLIKALDAGKNWKWFDLGLKVTGELTFGPKPGAADKG